MSDQNSPPSSSAAADGSAARVTLFGRVGCHLCDDARTVIERVCAELGETFAEIDIDTDPRLVEKYGAEIPVTLVDGRQHDFWRVSANRLRSALQA
ncbi:MAG: glutaredoxin family protein [Nocardioides sp.]